MGSKEKQKRKLKEKRLSNASDMSRRSTNIIMSDEKYAENDDFEIELKSNNPMYKFGAGSPASNNPMYKFGAGSPATASTQASSDTSHSVTSSREYYYKTTQYN